MHKRITMSSFTSLPILSSSIAIMIFKLPLITSGISTSIFLMKAMASKDLFPIVQKSYSAICSEEFVN